MNFSTLFIIFRPYRKETKYLKKLYDVKYYTVFNFLYEYINRLEFDLNE